MSFSISDHNNSKRVRVIKLNESDLDRLIFPFKKHSILSLEYKPFSRFSLAKSLDEVFQNKLSKTLSEILNDRKTGTAIVEPDIKNKKLEVFTKKELSSNNLYSERSFTTLADAIVPNTDDWNLTYNFIVVNNSSTLFLATDGISDLFPLMTGKQAFEKCPSESTNATISVVALLNPNRTESV